jgi:hypothetical protein
MTMSRTERLLFEAMKAVAVVAIVIIDRLEDWESVPDAELAVALVASRDAVNDALVELAGQAGSPAPTAPLLAE